MEFALFQRFRVSFSSNSTWRSRLYKPRTSSPGLSKSGTSPSSAASQQVRRCSAVKSWQAWKALATCHHGLARSGRRFAVAWTSGTFGLKSAFRVVIRPASFSVYRALYSHCSSRPLRLAQCRFGQLPRSHQRNWFHGRVNGGRQEISL